MYISAFDITQEIVSLIFQILTKHNVKLPFHKSMPDVQRLCKKVTEEDGSS